MRRINFITTVLMMCIAPTAFAQDSKLTIDNAIKIALEKNYDVLIYSNLSEKEKNNNTAGNAGMLPNLDLNASYVKSNNDLKQEYNNGTSIDRSGSGSTVANVDAGLNWTIFDGMKMFHTKKKLDGLFYQSQLQLKIQMENTIVEVVNAYYSIIKNDQQLKATQQEMMLLKDRLDISERKLNNGSGSKLDVLQAKIEYNRQCSIALATEAAISEAKINLNKLLAQEIESPFSTEDTVVISYKPSYEDLKKSISKNNTYLFYENNQRLAELSLKENKSMYFPKIALTSHYIFNRSTNEAGFSLLNQTKGYNYGISASLPIFHGSNINRQVRNSKLDVMNAKLLINQTNQELNSDLLNIYRNFTNSLEILQTEEDNILLAREVLQIAQERYKIGISNSIELQDSFRSFEESTVRLTEARFNAKLLETALRKTAGVLITSGN